MDTGGEIFTGAQTREVGSEVGSDRRMVSREHSGGQSGSDAVGAGGYQG